MANIDIFQISMDIRLLRLGLQSGVISRKISVGFAECKQRQPHYVSPRNVVVIFFFFFKFSEYILEMPNLELIA